MNYLTKLLSKDSDLLFRYFEEIKNLPKLDKEEELILIVNAQSGDRDACNLLLLCNLKFVVLVANQYRYKGIQIEDLISEGNLGLFDAITRFNPLAGVRFSSYAVWWVRSSIGKYVSAHRDAIRTPANIHLNITKINKQFRDLEKENNIESTKLKEELYKAAPPVTYLNPTLGNTGLNCIADESFMADLNVNVIENENEILNLLSKLDQRTHSIIKRYFGISNTPVKSLENIATEEGVSRETVRRIKDQGLKKLRELLEESINN